MSLKYQIREVYFQFMEFKAKWIIGVALGMLFSVLGFKSFMKTKEFHSRMVVAKGTVLRNVEAEGPKGPVFCPVIDYTIGGIHESYQDSSCANPPLLQVGEAVQVYVDQVSNEARLKSYKEFDLKTFLYISLGIFFLFGSGVVYWLANRPEPKRVVIKAKVVNISAFNDKGKRRTKLSFIEAVWVDPVTQEPYRFKSQGMPFDPTPLFQGKEVEIIIDPDNPGKKYRFKFDLMTDR